MNNNTILYIPYFYYRKMLNNFEIFQEKIFYTKSMKHKYINLFRLEDYKTLNKDLKFNSDNEYINHFNNIGKKQLRLCNHGQLEVVNEFGNEIILYIPYYYYLFKKDLLFNNIITTYEYMEPFYFWLPSNQVKYKKIKRWWIPQQCNPLILNDHEHINKFNTEYHIPIPLKEHYDSYEKIIKFNNDKPVIIISNKYNIEWAIGYYNYIDINTLKILFNMLKDKYNIIYFCVKNGMKNYSYDDNQIKQELDHSQLDFNENCIYFDEYIEKHNLY